MNNITLIGQLVGEPEMTYEIVDGNKKLYKLLVKISRKSYKEGKTQTEDFVNIKVWNNVLGDVYDYYDGSTISIEGRIGSFSNKEKTGYINEVIASKVMALV